MPTSLVVMSDSHSTTTYSFGHWLKLIYSCFIFFIYRLFLCMVRPNIIEFLLTLALSRVEILVGFVLCIMDLFCILLKIRYYGTIGLSTLPKIGKLIFLSQSLTDVKKYW